MNGEESSKSPKSKKEKLNIKDGETSLPTTIDAEAKTDSEAEADFKRLVEAVPPPMRSMMLQMTRMQGGGPFPHPIIDKFKPEHVGQFLDYTHEENMRELSLASSNRLFHLAYIALAALFLGFLIVYLTPINKDLLTDILRILLAFGGGFGAGFGAKSFLGKKE